MSPYANCLTPRQMKQVLLGRAPEEQADALEAHVEGCARCRQVLDQLHIDSLLTRALKERATAGQSQEGDMTPGVRELVERLEQFSTHWSLVSGGRAGEPEDTKESPFLAPAQAAGELGRLARYRVLELLGAGGMGLVYRAEDPPLQRLVALKVMRPKYARKPEARERFLREARAMAAIKHDHIVTIFEVGEAAGAGPEPVPFLAMELLEGESLADWLRQHGRPPSAWIIRLGRQAAAGLAAAHSRGLIHCDIKPANLWLEAPPGWADEPPATRPALAAVGRLKLLDFGLAAPIDDGRMEGIGAAASAREVMGTPAYMAPEQLRGEPLDGRCDLFALGCVLYELCTGELPFRQQLRARLLNDPPPQPVAEVNPAVAPALAELIGRLLALAPADRPASARLVEQQLAAIEREARTADTVSARHASTESLTPVPPAPAKRFRHWLRWTAAAAVPGLALLLWLIWRPGDGVPSSDPVAASSDTAARPPDAPRPAADEVVPAGPPDDAWCRFVAELPPERQAQTVLAKLRELNPGYDGRYERLNIGDGRVIELRFHTDAVTDIRPVRALTRLSSLGCIGSKPGRGRLTDLSPVRGLKLEWLFVNNNPDLSDLAPLRGISLIQFEGNRTSIACLDDLDGSRLQSLAINHTAVRDLTPARQMAVLSWLSLTGCPVESLEPLAETRIHTLSLSYRPERDEAVLRRMPALMRVNGLSIKDFWQKNSAAGF